MSNKGIVMPLVQIFSSYDWWLPEHRGVPLDDRQKAVLALGSSLPRLVLERLRLPGTPLEATEVDYRRFSAFAENIPDVGCRFVISEVERDRARRIEIREKLDQIIREWRRGVKTLRRPTTALDVFWAISYGSLDIGDVAQKW